MTPLAAAQLLTLSLDLVVLRCRDMKASRRLYEAIGLAFVAEQHGTGPVHYAAEIGRTVLELYPRTAQSSAGDPVQLGFSVADLPAVIDVLSIDAAGSDPIGQYTDSAVVRDPDCRPVHLRSAG